MACLASAACDGGDEGGPVRSDRDAPTVMVARDGSSAYGGPPPVDSGPSAGGGTDAPTVIVHPQDDAGPPDVDAGGVDATPVGDAAVAVDAVVPEDAAPPGPDGGPDAAVLPRNAKGLLMRSYDLARTGANLEEKLLTPADVNVARFGKLACRRVDHEIYGQILYAPNVDFGARGTRNAIYVVTMNNSVYAFDADSLITLWEAHYADPALLRAPVPATDVGRSCGRYKDISDVVGILSTPTIDPATNTMYLVARTKEGSPADKPTYVQRLHAISIVDGNEQAGSPVSITGSIPGMGLTGMPGMLTFNPRTQNQRAALTLHDGVVYVAWASHCDEGPYHGWIMGYDARSLQQVVVYNTTPNGRAGGIWMAGQGPSVDAEGNLYVLTGNGTADLGGGPNRSESFIKLRRQGNRLAILDWFTPWNYTRLEREDRDLGSSGAVLIPGSDVVLGGGKEGKLYLVDRNKMGRYRTTDDGQILQTVGVTTGRAHIHGTPVYWKNTGGAYVYVMGEEDYLRQYRFEGGQLQQFANSTVKAPRDSMGPRPGGYTMPGGMLTLSADGDRPESGIVWVTSTLGADANQAVVPGVLRAFEARDIGKELWNTQQNPGRDGFGNFAKFNPPTVYNGRVYLPTFSRQFCVYGKL